MISTSLAIFIGLFIGFFCGVFFTLSCLDDSVEELSEEICLDIEAMEQEDVH